MIETTQLERRTRKIADRLMENTPGLTRQQAKSKARPFASLQLSVEKTRRSIALFIATWNAAAGKKLRQQESRKEGT